MRKLLGLDCRQQYITLLHLFYIITISAAVVCVGYFSIEARSLFKLYYVTNATATRRDMVESRGDTGRLWPTVADSGRHWPTLTDTGRLRPTHTTSAPVYYTPRHHALIEPPTCNHPID